MDSQCLSRTAHTFVPTSLWWPICSGFSIIQFIVGRLVTRLLTLQGPTPVTQYPVDFGILAVESGRVEVAEVVFLIRLSDPVFIVGNPGISLLPVHISQRAGSKSNRGRLVSQNRLRYFLVKYRYMF